jgi:hypothetical protein
MNEKRQYVVGPENFTRIAHDWERASPGRAPTGGGLRSMKPRTEMETKPTGMPIIAHTLVSCLGAAAAGPSRLARTGGQRYTKAHERQREKEQREREQRAEGGVG